MEALFIFRRDFRIRNNPAWNRCVEWCSKNSGVVCPCFIYSDAQIKDNDYFSQKAYSAMRKLLDELDAVLDNKLAFFHGEDTDVLARLKPDAVFFNADVTPFARDRDAMIARWCEENGVHCGTESGYTLWPCGSILTKSGTVPKTFSAFYRYTKGRAFVRHPTLDARSVRKLSCPGECRPEVPEPSEVALPGIAQVRAFRGYGETRDDYSKCTTRMSVYLKFGVVDVGEFLSDVRANRIPELERQVLWREFYYHLAFGYPAILTAPNMHIRPDRQRVEWPSRDLGKWRDGETGEPLVDQAMRELKRTGYLHNRLRMVVSSYLTRDMGVDWREGEREMARMLIDYDPAQNSGGWQSMDAQIPGQEIKASTQRRKYGDVVGGCKSPPPGPTSLRSRTRRGR